MKRLILLPTRFIEQYGKGNDCLGYICLFEMIEKELGFKIIFTNDANNIPSDTEIVLCAFRNHSFPNLGSLRKGIKLILHLSDIHALTGKWINEHLSVLERADVILNSMDSLFKKQWPQYLDKLILFPQFFRPHCRYADLPYNENPIMKALLTGSLTENYYPIRKHIKNLLIENRHLRNLMDVARHPWYPDQLPDEDWILEPVIGNEYAKRLNQYFCCIATPGNGLGVPAKYLEIPAAGSLLLGVQTDDLDTLGFVPYKHYVPIVKDKVFIQVRHVLSNADNFEEIRMTGTAFVRANYSVNNRFEQLKEILKGL